jgi:hypothetical protein
LGLTVTETFRAISQRLALCRTGSTVGLNRETISPLACAPS